MPFIQLPFSSISQGICLFNELIIILRVGAQCVIDTGSPKSQACMMQPVILSGVLPDLIGHVRDFRIRRFSVQERLEFQFLQATQSLRFLGPALILRQQVHQFHWTRKGTVTDLLNPFLLRKESGT
jgi:hypothetical protein